MRVQIINTAPRKAFGNPHFASFVILALIVTHLLSRQWQDGFVCCPPGPWASVLPSDPAAQIASLPAFLTFLVTRAAAADTNTHRPVSEVERLCRCLECSQSNKAPSELAHLVESKETWHTGACLGSAF